PDHAPRGAAPRAAGVVAGRGGAGGAVGGERAGAGCRGRGTDRRRARARIEVAAPEVTRGTALASPAGMLRPLAAALLVAAALVLLAAIARADFAQPAPGEIALRDVPGTDQKWQE